jgi:hypothetical protein
MLTFTILAFVGVYVLREQIAREFPDGGPGPVGTSGAAT